MAAWQPTQEGLNQIIQLLQFSQSPDHDVQKQVNQQLQSLHNNPEYYRYLTYIFAKLQDQEEYIRTVAGLVLKNNIREHYKRIPEDIRNYMKNEIIQCLGDRKTTIRRTVGTIFTTIIDVTSMKECPGLLQYFLQLLNTSTDLNVIDGTLSALQKICQDSAEKIDSEDAEMGSPLQALLPKLISFFTSEHEAFRRFALSCVNNFVVPMPNVLAAHIDVYIRGLNHLANDSSSEIKVLVCQGLITLVEVRLEYVKPYLPAFIDRMLVMTGDEDEAVALEATEFWPVIAETRMCADILRANLGRIIPALLDGMVYSDSDIADFDAEEEDENVPDKPQDIKPFVYGKRGGGGGDDDDDDGDDDYEPEEWNLRKCSAAGLDIFASEFGDEILPIVLPVISSRLQSVDIELWPQKESAILALGAVAEGCGSSIEKFLPEIIPFLLQQSSHPKPLIRSITCWSLCRYGGWIAEQPDQQKYMQPLLQLLLSRLLDSHKRVQEAAVSALATFEEIARERLVPFLVPVCQALMAAYGKYQAKNLLILYDAIGTLAETLGSHLNKPEYVNILLPPLVGRWNELHDDDVRLFPLLECMMYVVTALGEGFLQYAPPVYARCLRLVESTLAAEMNQVPNPPDRDFIICSLDLIGGLVEGIREKMEPLIKESRLLDLLFMCMKHESGDVRQSAFALVGELSKSSIGLLAPCLGQYVPVLIHNIHPEHQAACNNAVWAIGEISMRVGSQIQPMVAPVMGKLIEIINGFYPRNLIENVAITIGRMGLVCPQAVAPYLEEFIVPWCNSLRCVRDDGEKESAFKGLCTIINANPQAAIKHLTYIADAIASWDHPKPELAQAFAHILQSFKGALAPDAWRAVHESWPPGLREILHERYRI
jgi:hypothetical protein